MIGTDVQNTTRPDLKAAKEPSGARREMIKQLVLNRMKKAAHG